MSSYPVPYLTTEYKDPVKFPKLWKLPPTNPLTSPYIPVPIPLTKAWGPCYIPTKGSLAIS